MVRLKSWPKPVPDWNYARDEFHDVGITIFNLRCFKLSENLHFQNLASTLNIFAFPHTISTTTAFLP